MCRPCSSIMNKAGISVEVLYLDKDSKTKDNTRTIGTSTPPPRIVYGEVKSKANPNGKTFLFYNPYEVPPEVPVRYGTL
jgi:hypothetical protein